MAGHADRKDVLPQKEEDMEFERFYSSMSMRRTPSVFRELHTLSLKLPQKPINLAGGMPHPCTFPFKEASFKLEDGTQICLSAEVMSDAMQYQPGLGYGPLLKSLEQLVQETHQPPHWDQRKILTVSGAQEALGLLTEALVEEGDGVIIPEYCYATMMLVLMPLRPKLIPVPVDKDGMVIEKLEELIASHRGTKIKMLYQCPSGSNPSGETTSAERRKQIYKLACQHDFLILEDDAYFYLNLKDEPLPPSYLSMDSAKRVIRVDTFAKSVGPGLRLGWITAPPEIISRVQRHAHAFTMHPSVLSQAAVHQLLASWGKEGWQKHLRSLRLFYTSQRDAMAAAARKHLHGLVEWDLPQAGMYFWMKLVGVPDSRSLVLHELLSAGVMVCPGNSFTVDHSRPSPYVRVSYSYCEKQDFEEGFRIFAKVLRDQKEKQKQ